MSLLVRGLHALSSI